MSNIVTRYEYNWVSGDEVNEHAKVGWRLVDILETNRTEPAYVMEREYSYQESDNAGSIMPSVTSATYKGAV